MKISAENLSTEFETHGIVVNQQIRVPCLDEAEAIEVEQLGLVAS